MSHPIIEAAAIDKFYQSYQALHGVSLTVAPGEFLALVGPSGCGKTSLLKILAGFEDPTSGDLMIEGKHMVGVPPSQRPTRMVFQKLALFPHKTVAENIGFPLKLAKVAHGEIDRRVREMLSLMHLKESYMNRLPAQLSGGEQQRVALARSMISKPSVLLLDEPLSALDAKLKKSLQAELKRLHRNLGTSFVHVTHDLEEAMMLADRICVMRAGHMLQVGTPEDIYYRPATTFVAGFIGETNLLPVMVAAHGGQGSKKWRFASPSIACADPVVDRTQSAPTVVDGDALMMLRPEMIHLLPEGTPDMPCAMTGIVDEYFVKGASIQYRVSVEGLAAPVILEVPGTLRRPADVGEPVRLGFRRLDAYLLPADPHAGVAA
ncbi:MAG: ABC transporter ATP-binding protein [Rhodospirillum sp.]|nr:ABC transporter ATP-binding protein [Rhodospirillum sp.]MCF8491589.1 ABC transporter ATP-binding protein [Rhodospirillum sp.]MCF8500929.1 ABC transporter ATP-binding protein [Rhodospirillum sp.]